MYEWKDNSNGNLVYGMGSDGVMTVFKAAGGGWKGIYEGATTKGTYNTADEAMRVMETAVLAGKPSLLSRDPGWQRAKDGGYYWVSRVGALSVKSAKSGKWYISRMGEVIEGVWCDTALAAMKTAEVIHGLQ